MWPVYPLEPKWDEEGSINYDAIYNERHTVKRRKHGQNCLMLRRALLEDKTTLIKSTPVTEPEVPPTCPSSLKERLPDHHHPGLYWAVCAHSWLSSGTLLKGSMLYRKHMDSLGLPEFMDLFLSGT